MSDIKLSLLPLVTSASGGDYVIANVAGVDVIITKANLLSGVPDNTGWISAIGTWTYSSWDATNKLGVITVPSDATLTYSAGMRVRISQTTGGTKYGIIVKITASALTVYFGTSYTFTNETVSSPSYSIVKTPFGFPLDPILWTQLLTDTGSYSQSPPVINTWYNLGSLSLTLPIGSWRLSYRCDIQENSTSSSDFQATLSTSSSSASDNEFTGHVFDGSQNPATVATLSSNKNITVTSNTVYYLIERALGGASPVLSVTNIYLKAVCNYL